MITDVLLATGRGVRFGSSKLSRDVDGAAMIGRSLRPRVLSTVGASYRSKISLRR